MGLRWGRPLLFWDWHLAEGQLGIWDYCSQEHCLGQKMVSSVEYQCQHWATISSTTQISPGSSSLHVPLPGRFPGRWAATDHKARGPCCAAWYPHLPFVSKAPSVGFKLTLGSGRQTWKAFTFHILKKCLSYEVVDGKGGTGPADGCVCHQPGCLV